MVKKKLKNGSGKENQSFNLFKEFRFKSSKLETTLAVGEILQSQGWRARTFLLNC